MEEHDIPIFKLASYVRAKTRCINAADATMYGPAVIDCHFIKVVVDETVDRAEFERLVLAAEQGEFRDMPLETLQQGPGYIPLGAWIGDQTLALRFMALCEAAGCSAVVTPKTLHVEGPDADKMAGNGFVMLAGFRAEE